MATVIAIVIAQLTVASQSLLVHSAVLALRTTNDELDEARRLADHLATIDPLTGAANRRSFTDLVATVDHRDLPHTLLLVDIDRFKSLNDHHGHLVGDEVIREVAARLAEALPRSHVARWGGEEFAVLCAHADDRPATAGETLRDSVACAPIRTSVGEVVCTVSVGGTTWTTDDSFEDALRRADAAMYHAKGQGRNRSAVRPAGSVGADDVRRPA